MEACCTSFDSASISSYVTEENFRKSEINGCAGDNVELLLEVEVSQSLYKNRSRKSKDNRLVPDELVEVTIIHPVASESKTTVEQVNSRSPKILYLTKEDDKVHGDHRLDEKVKENISEIKNNKINERIEIKNNINMSKSKVPLRIPQSGNHYRSDHSDNVGSDQDGTLTDSLESHSKTVVKEESATADDTSKKIEISQISKKETSGPVKIPFVELGAVRKVLDRLKTEVKRTKSPKDNSSKEVILKLQNLLGEWDERKLDEFLKKDQSLAKCEYCGVISCLKSSKTLIHDTESNRQSPDDQRSSKNIYEKNYLKINERSITTRKDNNDKQDIRSSAQTRSRFSQELSEVSGPRNAAGYGERYLRAIDPIQNKTMAAERDFISNEVSRKAGTSFKNSLPVPRPTETLPKRASLSTSRRRTPCERNTENHISNGGTRSKIKTGKKTEVENDVVDKQRRFGQRNETQEKTKRRTFNNPRVGGDAITGRRCRSSDMPKSEEPKNECVKNVIRKELKMESKTPEKFENFTACSLEVQSVFPVELTPLKDTMKYLAKGEFSTGDKNEDKNKIFNDSGESSIHRIFDKRKQNFVLRASRDNGSQLDSGFWLCDGGRAKNICEKFEKSNEPTFALAKDTCENERSFKSEDAISLGNRTEEKLENFPESDTTTFSSSSAENLIREWMKPDEKILQTLGTEKSEVGDKEVSDSMEKLLSSDKRAEIIRVIKEKISKAIEKGAAYSIISEDKLYDDENLERGKIKKNISKCSVGEDLIKKIDKPIELRSNKKKFEIKSPKACCCEHSLRPFDISREIIEKIWGTKESSLKSIDDPIHEKRRLANQQYIIISAPTTKIEETQKESLKVTYRNPISGLSSSSTENHLDIENSERVEREVIYDDDSSHDTIGTDTVPDPASRVLPMYRKILDSNEEMDWESFQQLIGTLHPKQRDLWGDICKAISNEAKRVAGETGGTTEVCIEIDPVPCKERKGKICTRSDEVRFEMDMTLKDVEIFLDKKLEKNHENSKDKVRL